MVSPYGLVFDPQRGLLVSDPSANRVLLFSMINPTSGEPAATVIGQSNFVSTSNSVLSSPRHIAEDTIAELYVADLGHNQITIFAIPTGTSTDQPIGSFTGLNSPQAVWVNQNPVVGPTNDIWVGDSSGLSRYTPLAAGATSETPTLRMPAAELTGGQSAFCTGSSSFCVLPAIAIAQDSYGALYVADSSNRVQLRHSDRSTFLPRARSLRNLVPVWPCFFSGDRDY
jgi:DNA-binding beta-propeller fold protein YncE